MRTEEAKSVGLVDNENSKNFKTDYNNYPEIEEEIKEEIPIILRKQS